MVLCYFWLMYTHQPQYSFNPLPDILSDLNHHPLEFVSCYCDTQLQMGENYCYFYYFKTKQLPILIFTGKHPIHSQ